MKIVRSRHLLLSTAIILFCAHLVSAQSPLEPAQMPASTMFYLVWRGQPSADLRKTNSIAALWDDPGFTPVRSAVTKALLRNSEEKSTEPQLTSSQLDEYAALLENPFVIGYLSDPQKHAPVASASPAQPKIPSWNGMFFVYDRKGKEALLSKAVLGLRAHEKEIPQLSQLTIADLPVLKVQRRSGVTYWVEHGKYAISANETAVLEEILSRLNGKPSSSSALADSAAYKEAQPVLGSGQVEFFLRVPDLKALASESNAGGFRMRPLLDAIKLDAVHSLCGHVILADSKTRVQAVVLGDTASGSLFDIWDQGAPSPASLNFVPADAISYSDTQFNLVGLYDTVKRIANSIFPPGRQGNTDMLDTMAQARLGQPLTSALALFTGEFASLQTSPSLDSSKQIYLIGIRNKPDTLKLLHSVMSDRITSERIEGETTFMKISAGGAQGAGAAAQSNFYHVAVTSDYLLAANRLEAVRELLAKRSQNVTAGLSTSPAFQSTRAQFPTTINGLGYFDFRKLDWQALKNRLIAESHETSETKRAPGAAKSAATVTPSWIQDVNPDVLARHLHVASSASWKDAQGLHFDQWIE